MIDREKVIANLTRCQHGLCDECDLEHASHYVWDCEVQDQLINDALELLKAQEPIRAEDFYKPINNEAHSYVSDMWRCGACESRIYYHQKYCGACGKAVKWDE